MWKLSFSSNSNFRISESEHCVVDLILDSVESDFRTGVMGSRVIRACVACCRGIRQII